MIIRNRPNIPGVEWRTKNFTELESQTGQWRQTIFLSSSFWRTMWESSCTWFSL